MNRIAGFLRLTRLPLVFTAIADSAAGYFVGLPAGARPNGVVLGFLAAASACLYACGMVLNDVADFPRDRSLHPERPLPSGQVTLGAARWFGLVLMFLAALFGGVINVLAAQGVLAALVLIFAYNFFLKSHAVPGALAMGALRAVNFTLGVLAVAPLDRGAMALPPWATSGYAQALLLGGYVFFLTLMSTTEERPRKALFVLCGVAMAAVPAASLAIRRSGPAIAMASVLGALLLVHALVSLRSLDRSTVMRNVRWGILAIIPLDASFVMAKAGLTEGVAVLALAVPALVLLPLFRRL